MSPMLSTKDLDAALAVMHEAATADGEHPFEVPVIEQLAALVPADLAGYFEYHLEVAEVYSPHSTVNDHIVDSRETSWPLPWCSDEVIAALETWPLHDSRHCCSTTAVKFSDGAPTRLKRLRNLWYQTMMRPSNVEHEMKLWLPSPPGVVRGFYFIRYAGGRPDFDERDRAVLTVLRPHLHAVRERWGRRHQPPGLTDREAEVVHLLRDGLTNQEIADRLVISTGTVRTHLENIFGKLGVHSRTAAVARAFEPGS